MSTAAPSASISNVEVAHTGQQTTVRISGTGELRYQASRLDLRRVWFWTLRIRGWLLRSEEGVQRICPGAGRAHRDNRIPGNRAS